MTASKRPVERLLSSWPWALTSLRRRVNDETNFWKYQTIRSSWHPYGRPRGEVLLLKSFSLTLPALWHHGSLVSGEPRTHDRKQSYLYLWTDWTALIPREYASPTRGEWTWGSVTPHSVCVLFCVWCDVCVRERMCRNQCNTIECCSVGGHTLSS